MILSVIPETWPDDDTTGEKSSSTVPISVVTSPTSSTVQQETQESFHGLVVHVDTGGDGERLSNAVVRIKSFGGSRQFDKL